jgi:hypothetical protein
MAAPSKADIKNLQGKWVLVRLLDDQSSHYHLCIDKLEIPKSL